ncbi:hypothetical protein [Atlantibacter hermannii]|uniref:hypothetical protein n=1 Tax=Atlantibacter hermannii TaxID=565 RepID=UPI00254AE08A|nr:hypothetical protein [Atlantibacter hermannii]
MTRIENIKQLTAFLNTQLGIAFCGMPIEDHGITYFYDLSPKKIRAQLQKKLTKSAWDGYSYRDEEMNILILLQNAGGVTMCIATVLSLHLTYLEQFDY